MRSRIPVKLLAARLLPGADPALCRALGVPEDLPALALFSTDCDDATYLALDEATKAAPVAAVYGRSHYAGAGAASTPISGEVTAVLAGPTPAETRSGLAAAIHALEGLGFTEGPGGVPYLAHVVSRTGTFLSREAEVPEGAPLAYLIAPPVAALVGLDAALKASEVRLAKFYAPPTETNFAGALLTGTQSACRAACEAFAAAIEAVAQTPVKGV